MTPQRGGQQQAGVVLLVSLLVLLVMGVIASTVAKTNLLQLHMSGNDEARTSAMQRALAVIDGVVATSGNFRMDVGAGHRLCPASATTAGCDAHSLSLEPKAVPATGHLDVAVLRLAPEQGRMPVLAENAANSTVHYRVAKFEVQVAYTGTPDQGGRVALAQGVLVRLSQSTRFAGGVP